MIWRTLQQQHEKSALTSELQAIFSDLNLDVCFFGDTLQVGVNDTIENRAKIESVISAHDYTKSIRERKLITIRANRDKLLTNSDFVILRHLEQKQLNITPKLTDEKYSAWLQYRQDLRDLPAKPDLDVDKPTYPKEP